MLIINLQSNLYPAVVRKGCPQSRVVSTLGTALYACHVYPIECECIVIVREGGLYIVDDRNTWIVRGTDGDRIVRSVS